MSVTKIKLLVPVMLFIIAACGDTPTPKPRGYHRIDLPVKAYHQFESTCPFSFDYPEYALPVPNKSTVAEDCWLDIQFYSLNATLHLSYKTVSGNLRTYLEDSRSLAMKHTQRANDIREIPVIRDSAAVYGLLYDIKGNAASSLQFYLTDSTNHFVRGSLYFNNPPNIDSVAPVLDFLREDVERMIETFRWKNQSS